MKLERAYSRREEEDCEAKPKEIFRMFSESFPQGRVVILPLLKDYGNAIEWQVRVHPKNAVGPLRLSKETAALIGASKVLVDAAENIKSQLQEKYAFYPYDVRAAQSLIRREMSRLQQDEDLV